MDNKEKIQQLLREYGYPEQMIQHYMEETTELDYEEVKKRVMPYQDITAQR